LVRWCRWGWCLDLLVEDGMPSSSRVVCAILLSVGICLVSHDAAAQDERLALSVSAGPSPYDLSGTGTGVAGALALTWRPIRGLLIEPGTTAFTYRSQFGTRFTYLLPELSIQGELRLGPVRPFFGVGAGGAFVVQGPRRTDPTLHATLGSRIQLGAGWGARAELRVRSVRPWAGTMSDVLLGLSRAL
jgi:hypothetical protein